MPDLQIADSLEVVLAKDLASVPQVRHILIESDDGPLIVWIAVDDAEPSVHLRVEMWHFPFARVQTAALDAKLNSER